MEKIALQMPLSAIERPVWDRNILKEMGFESVSIDLNIWERVWSQEEKLNYHSTPMFMICAEKQQEDLQKAKGLSLDRTGNKEKRFSKAGRRRICPSLYSDLRQ